MVSSSILPSVVVPSVIGDTLDIAAEAVGGRVESTTTSDIQSEQGPRSLIDGNSLTVWESEPRSTSPHVAKTIGIDIVSTGFEGLPHGGPTKMLRARMGTLSTLLEAAILRDLGAQGVPSLMTEADSQGVPAILLTGPEDPALSLITFERPVRVRSGPDFGWWRIDPASGEILGVLGNREGGAQGGTEYSLWKGVMVSAAVGGLSGYAFCQMLNDGQNYVRVYGPSYRPPPHPTVGVRPRAAPSWARYSVWAVGGCTEPIAFQVMASSERWPRR